MKSHASYGESAYIDLILEGEEPDEPSVPRFMKRIHDNIAKAKDALIIKSVTEVNINLETGVITQE